MFSRKTRVRARRVVRRGRRVAANAGKGIKGSAVEVIAGAGAYFLHSYARENFQAYRDNEYAPAVLLGVAGHVLKRSPKLAPAGHSLCGIAGFMAAETYDENKKQNANAPAAPAADPAQVQGFDIGAFNMGNPAVMLEQSPVAEAAAIPAF
jgi:hypothetical protein